MSGNMRAIVLDRRVNMSNEMKLSTSVSASTKVNNVHHKSNLVIDWTGMTVDDLQALAQRSIVIRKQNADRTKEVIPPENETIMAVDYRIGVRTARPVQLTPQQMLDALSPEDRAALLAQYLTGSHPNA